MLVFKKVATFHFTKVIQWHSMILRKADCLIGCTTSINQFTTNQKNVWMVCKSILLDFSLQLPVSLYVMKFGHDNYPPHP
jgi:hypothetical protein